MERNGIKQILNINDIRGERMIAVFQSFMALIILILHLVSASKTGWETVSGFTLAVIAGILLASGLRVAVTKSGQLPKLFLHLLTMIDGALLFALIFSYNVAYDLPFVAAFKAPSIVLFVVFTCVRVVKFDPATILVAGFTVLFGWGVMHGLAVLDGSNITSSYAQYVSSSSIMLGASFEFAIGYVCAILALSYAMFLARGFIAQTASIDDLERANQVSEQNAAQFENLFASSVEGILIVDQNGNIERSNGAMARLFGYEQSELIGSNAEMLMSAQNAQLLRMSIADYLERGESPLVGQRFETEGINRKGEVIPIELSINNFAAYNETCFAAFIQDISDRKRSEEKEKLAKAQFENAVNAAMDAIIIIDEDGMIVGFNPAAEETFGFKLKDVAGKRLSETIIPHRYRDAHDAGMEHYLKTGEGPVLNSRIEIEGLHASGEELQIELAIREINTENGKLFFGYARDIGERKAAEQELLNAKNEAEVASNAKARFLAMMSHEIRTPLNGVLGIVNLLDETELDKEQRKLLSTARDSGQSLLSIINDILDFSKLEAGKFTIENSPFELRTLIKSIVNLIKPQATEKGLVLNFMLEPAEERVVLGDPDRIRQVVLNLVWNAVKFTNKGSIDVRVIALPENQVRFEVIDTGIGIAEDKMDVLFADFSTLDEQEDARVSGTGLGLVICKSLVEAMGGSIHVESTKGYGSRFWFDLPLEESKEPVATESETDWLPAYEEQLSGKKILVAEDNVTNQFIIRNYLSRIGCLVDLANDGVEAVSMFMNGHYDMILMDVSMPKLDGFGATAQIRDSGHENASLPILAFTAYASREDRERVMQNRMDAHVTKPFTREQLLGTMVKFVADKDVHKPVASAGDNIDQDAPEFDLDSVAAVFQGQDMETSRMLLEQFAHDLQSYRTTIITDLADNDWQGIERASHALKGSSGMFGARRLSQLAEKVNRLCREGKIENQQEFAVSLITETKSILDKVSDTDDGALPEFVVQATAENAQ